MAYGFGAYVHQRNQERVTPGVHAELESRLGGRVAQRDRDHRAQRVRRRTQVVARDGQRVRLAVDDDREVHVAAESSVPGANRQAARRRVELEDRDSRIEDRRGVRRGPRRPMRTGGVREAEGKEPGDDAHRHELAHGPLAAHRLVTISPARRPERVAARALGPASTGRPARRARRPGLRRRRRPRPRAPSHLGTPLSEAETCHLDAQLFAEKAVKVDVHEGAARRLVLLHERERGAGHTAGNAELAGDRPHQKCFSRSEVAGKNEEVTRGENSGYRGAETTRIATRAQHAFAHARERRARAGRLGARLTAPFESGPRRRLRRPPRRRHRGPLL